MSENQPQTPDAPRPDGDAFDAATLRVPVTSDRDDAAARIAELVRRSNERSSAAPASTAGEAPTPPAAPAPAPTPAPAPPPAPAADPAGEATQAWPAPAADPDPDATQAWQPVAEHRPQAPLDPEATQAMPSVGAEPTQAVRYASSGVSEATPVAPLDYDATAQVPLPTAADAAHTTAFESPAVTPAPAGPAGPRRRGLPVPSWAIVAGLVAVIALLVWAFTGGGGSGEGQGNASAGSSAGAGQAAPAGFQVRLSDTVTDCAAHSRGKVKETFRQVPCVKVTRSVGTGTVNGRKVLFVVSRIEMSSSDDAARIKAVLDGDGTGNVNDLLREGKRFAGGPGRMPRSGYASVQADEIVGVAEAGYLDGTSSDSDPALRDAAARVAESVGTH
ncbi:hypothetical protein [Oryzihumus leptocrescens]|uniref:Uncharacterized protein n=1 Tax=Oryzihumus leptocrescens TaxID=297536 RepID=A0A542ZHR5_9MICO|nr:hypothetical protein [Oryzihumus leptocrescens]TQL59871.1 hypothetical protein FB474_1241 [Oryzihumus leptocrescens]